MEEIQQEIAVEPAMYDATIYPSLLKRVQSTFIDGIFTFILIGLLVTLANSINDNSVTLKVIAIFLGLSYEPISIAFSRTIGQRITGIRVVSVNNGKKVNILLAYLRYIVKTILGWLSFLTMHRDTQRRAFHDFIANTVVVSTR